MQKSTVVNVCSAALYTVLAKNHFTLKIPVRTSNTKLMKSHVTTLFDTGAKMSYSHSYCHCAIVELP